MNIYDLQFNLQYQVAFFRAIYEMFEGQQYNSKFRRVTMARYKCRACGYVFDEEKEGKSIRDIDYCPRCHQPDDMFLPLEEEDERNSDSGIDGQ